MSGGCAVFDGVFAHAPGGQGAAIRDGYSKPVAAIVDGLADWCAPDVILLGHRPPDWPPGQWCQWLRPPDSTLTHKITVICLPEARAAGVAVGPWVGWLAHEVAQGLRAFREAVGIDWAGTTGATAEALILSTHPKEKGGVFADRTPVVPPVVGLVDRSPMLYTGPLGGYRAGLTLHGFDLGAQHLGAWQVLECGIGQPVHDERTLWDRRAPGLWHLDLPAQLPMGHGPLPGPWDPRAQWHLTPTVARAGELGVPLPERLEAWTWAKRSRFLRAAGERLRDARASLMLEVMRRDDTDPARAGAQLALAAVKDVYTVQGGRMSAAWMNPRGGFARPDWGLGIVQTARCNLDRRLRRVAAAPLAVLTDGVLYLSEIDAPGLFATEVGLPTGMGLGEFRSTGSLPWSKELRKAFGGARTAQARFALYRKALSHGTP